MSLTLSAVRGISISYPRPVCQLCYLISSHLADLLVLSILVPPITPIFIMTAPCPTLSESASITSLSYSHTGLILHPLPYPAPHVYHLLILTLTFRRCPDTQPQLHLCISLIPPHKSVLLIPVFLGPARRCSVGFMSAFTLEFLAYLSLSQRVIFLPIALALSISRQRKT
ncbi:hypothetical protein GALMADRAFT_1103255 [Galerina marginata CBS 339.88]|uniref:Uncharacterized protein n=1 Tax=Galerina marginata (strain CBS 339.88) TaxID=685588 RepID=A0A067TLC8_GALM3|nr:hypothetical protein GALMADRAFT_1103255 [Galerina marginata CBS 339.88]